MESLGQFRELDVGGQPWSSCAGTTAPDGTRCLQKVANLRIQDYSVATQAPAYPALRNCAAMARAS